ncbi:MAG: DUF3810 domain-containing protein [Oscillospiraceae bacterium]|nr:DUF3810 domain-containing protein [Oscillospiraceae bacterium]
MIILINIKDNALNMKKALIYLSITALINIIIRIISKNSSAFSEWYAINIYPFITGIFGRITGVLPFAAVEILLYILILSFITGLVLFIKRLIKVPKKRIKTLLSAIVALSCTVSTFMVMFLFGCEINYNRQTFPEQIGLNLEMYSKEDLRRVIDEVIDELNKIVPRIQTDENGMFVMNRDKLNTLSGSSMLRLSEIDEQFNTYYPNPKPVLLSELLFTRTLTCGMFSPFTIEALYNADMPDSEIPFTVCHELSHLSGFMREDEANFIAFLACRGSGDIDFRYSGYVNALVYLINAYYNEVDRDIYIEMRDTIPEQVRFEFFYVSEYWRPYRNTPAAKVSSSVNDVYLKSNGQTDGVKSYGRMVDLLIADYIGRI